MKSGFLVLALMFLLTTTLVRADGGFFPPVYYAEDITEPTQKAAILFSNSQERIVLQVEYGGSMNDFAWIIPVPNYPTVNKSDPLLFEELHYLTEPIHHTAPDLFPLMFIGATAAMSQKSVTLLERQQVGIYDVSIISATNSTELVDWLSGNNYSIPKSASDVLNYYISKKWFFIAVRINLAPFDDKLITTLKTIDGRITDQSSAVSYLTEDLASAVKSKKLYSDLDASFKSGINYSDDTKSKVSGGYPYYYSDYNTPRQLIDSYAYTNIYESYNGYLEEHMLSDMNGQFLTKLEDKIRIPSYYDCFDSKYHYQDFNVTRCDVWYLGKDSEEYNLLKGVNCGTYCPMISDSKSRYTPDDLSYVAANAILNGDEGVKSYFGVTSTQTDWYQNYGQKFEYVRSIVKDRITSKLQTVAFAARSALEATLVREYSLKIANSQTFSTVGQLSYFFSQLTLADFKQGRIFSDSQISQFDLISLVDYTGFYSHYLGNHDEGMLQNSISTIVKNVVYWESSQVSRQLTSGTIQPLMITFSASEIIYPLKISSINKGASEILLYVFSNHRTSAEGFTTEYAKWLNPSDIRTKDYTDYISQYGNKPTSEVPNYYRRNVYFYTNQLLDDRYFLTKMRRMMYPSEMEDLTIKPADNDAEYRLETYEDGYVLKWGAFILGMGFLALLITAAFLPARWLNNRIMKDRNRPILMVTPKRCLAYAIAFMILSGLYLAFYNYLGGITELMRAIGGIIDIIGKVLNLVGVPTIVIGLVTFALAILIIFYAMHALGLVAIRIVEKVKTRSSMPSKE
jgi:hypothetical protein